MTAERVTAVSGFPTFVVIAPTGIAALVQLRHMRNSNQITIFEKVRDEIDMAENRAAEAFVINELPKKGPILSFTRSCCRAAATIGKLRRVGNFGDHTAAFVKHRMVDRDLACTCGSAMRSAAGTRWRPRFQAFAKNSASSCGKSSSNSFSCASAFERATPRRRIRAASRGCHSRIHGRKRRSAKPSAGPPCRTCPSSPPESPAHR